jgi:ABC-type uncharacterized transport system substrate-binding protein
MVNVSHPVENGLVASLARPGGNVTGLTRLDLDLTSKNLSLLAEAVPELVRVAVLSNPTHPGHPPMVRSAKEVAQSLGLQLTIVEAGAPNELENAFSVMARTRARALLVLADGMFWAQRTRIVDLALRHRLPSMFGNTEFAEAGGLMTYAPNSVAPYSRVGYHVDPNGVVDKRGPRRTDERGARSRVEQSRRREVCQHPYGSSVVRSLRFGDIPSSPCRERN